MSPWITVLIGGGAAGGTFELIKHWMNLRLYRHTYDEGGPGDMLAAAQAVKICDHSLLGRARTAIRRRERH
jgi:hypothetical protein